MFITKRRHESEIAKLDQANKGLLRDIVAERARFNAAIKDLAEARFEIEDLRPDAGKWRARAAREKARGLRRNARSAG
jgi:hypothetical protein